MHLASHTASVEEVWLPDHLGVRAGVVAAVMNFFWDIVKKEPLRTSTTPHRVAGGLLVSMLRDSANLIDDAKHVRSILERHMGSVNGGGEMWRHAEKVYRAVTHGVSPSDKAAIALRVGGIGVELLQRTRQTSTAKVINGYFAQKYKDALASVPQKQGPAPTPHENLRSRVDAWMVIEAQQAATLLGNDLNKALLFIKYILDDVNFHALVENPFFQKGGHVDLTDGEIEAALDIAGQVQDTHERAVAFGVALLEAVGAPEAALKLEQIAIRAGKGSGLFLNRLADKSPHTSPRENPMPHDNDDFWTGFLTTAYAGDSGIDFAGNYLTASAREAAEDDQRVDAAVEERLSGKALDGSPFKSLRGLTDAGRASAALSLPVDADTRVTFASNLGAVLAYEDPPQPNMTGTVVAVKTASGQVTDFEGKVFVRWADGVVRPIHAEHLRVANGTRRQHAADRIRVASLGDLTDFFRSASSSDTLIHKATKDLWKLSKDTDGYVLERLFQDSGNPIDV